jgi:LacI family transcriptional regulator
VSVPPRITMRDVARAAGVSIQTVSRVLNDRPDVSSETGERIRRVIEELGYAPNLLARGLTSGRTQAIGVVAYGLGYFGPSQVVIGIEREAAALGYAMSLTLVHDAEALDVDATIGALASRQVDGIVWAVPEVGANRDWIAGHAALLALPLVVVGGSCPTPAVPTIGIDNAEIGRVAARHVLAGGARRVAGVTGPLSWVEARHRRDGALEVLAAAGMDADETMFIEGDWGAASGEAALREIVARWPDVDAVLAGNDQEALGVLHAAHGLGLDVPGTLAVVGVDNIPESSHFQPALTTVEQPLLAAGALAVRELAALVDRREGRGPKESPMLRLLAPTLVVRESSRQPA